MEMVTLEGTLITAAVVEGSGVKKRLGNSKALVCCKEGSTCGPFEVYDFVSKIKEIRRLEF